MMTKEQEAAVYLLIADFIESGGVLTKEIHQDFINQVINA